MQVDFSHLRPEVPVLVHPKCQDHFFARAGTIADIAIGALKVRGVDSKLRLGRLSRLPRGRARLPITFAFFRRAEPLQSSLSPSCPVRVQSFGSAAHYQS
jgi:hypothetical protein